MNVTPDWHFCVSAQLSKHFCMVCCRICCYEKRLSCQKKNAGHRQLGTDPSDGWIAKKVHKDAFFQAMVSLNHSE